jgi:septal ring factor EnvC (AmiA/AmiB activator)
VRVEYEESFDREVQRAHEERIEEEDAQLEEVQAESDRLAGELARREAEVAAVRHEVDVVRREKLGVERENAHLREARALLQEQELARVAAAGDGCESDISSPDLRSPKKSSKYLSAFLRCTHDYHVLN